MLDDDLAGRADLRTDQQSWLRCQRAVAVEVDRVAGLLRSLPSRAGSAAVGGWDLIEVAVHLSQTWIALPGLARADMSEVATIVPDRGAGAGLASSLDELGAVTTRAVATEPERDPAVLADRIESRARDYLAVCPGQVPGLRRPWLVSGVTVPVPVFTAHLLSETVVHGWDIARAAGRPWRIDPVHAGLVVREFLLPVLFAGGSAVFSDAVALAAARGRYRLDVRGQEAVPMMLDEAGAHLDTGAGRADCQISVDTVAFLLMFFGRRGPVGTALRGGLLAWGPKPWLALRLQRALPHP